MSRQDHIPVPPPAAPKTVEAVPPAPKRVSPWFKFLRRGGAFNEENLFLLLAVIIGLFAGLSVVCFRISIDWIRLFLFGSSLTPSVARLLLVPVAGGLVVAFLTVRYFKAVRGSGVNQTKAAVYIYDGYIPFSTVIGKFIACSLAIGSGQSLGPEDPSLQMGAGIASALGRRLRLSREKVRLIAPVGAAAGLAAAFNSPIAAVLFVIEEVIGKWSAGVLGAIVLSAVSSVVVERLFLGSEPLFRVPTYQLVHPIELAAYAVMGIVGGVASLIFVKLIAYSRPKVKKFPSWCNYGLPAVAGLFIGIIAMRFPQVMGAGYEYMDQAMHGQFPWRILLLLGMFKILATSASFVSGTPGGMFAPTLFIGAMVGGAVGSIEHIFFPQLTGSVGAYALVGMGTLFAGFLRAPMTSVFMVLEVSGNYSMIIPVMISNTIAYLISRKYQPTALFDLLSRQDGLVLPSMEEEREESPLRVEDAMRPATQVVLRADESIAEALQKIEKSQEEYFLVSQETGGWTGIPREALKQYQGSEQEDSPLISVLASKQMPYLHPDHLLDVAMQQIDDWPLLPVVHRANFKRLEGVLSLEDILKAYRNYQRD